MSGALFMLDVFAFVALIYWAYRTAMRPESEAGGLFGMKTVAEARNEGPAAPKWQGTLARRPSTQPALSSDRKPAAWKSPLQRRR